MQSGDNSNVDRVFELIATLRGDGGCPWDREQALEDVLSDLIEEAYELEWAATHSGDSELVDEMGDVLFLLCFALSIKKESHPDFTMERIAAHAHDKIRSRHPHVFGTESAATTAESVAHWERIKAQERRQKNADGGTLDGVAGNLPPLRHAEKIQQRAASVGFDWDNASDIIAKLREEVDELEEAIQGGNRSEILHEVGDILFSVVNVTRFLELDVEGALSRSTSKFIQRFEEMERLIRADGKAMQDMTLPEMDAYWERVKAS